MDQSPLTPRRINAYLAALGVEKGPATLHTLRAVVRAHLMRVPFENISKLWRLGRLGLCDVPDIDLFLDGIRRHHLGGTCYSNNLQMCRLLAGLGFDATLCGADMPSGEDVHVAIVVRINGRPWLVDAGYAAPFLAPLRLDLDREQVVKRGSERWVLHPRDADGRWRMQLWRGGEPLHSYMLKPRPCLSEHFDRAVRDSFRPEATFMNSVLIVRCLERGSVVFSNLTRIRSTGTRARVKKLANLESLAGAIQADIGIPAALVREATANLGELGDPYG